MELLPIVLAGLGGIVIGLFVGYSLARFFKYLADKKIKKGAIEVLQGKRENKFNLDGKMLDVDRFKMRDDNDKDIIIDLHGNKLGETPKATRNPFKEMKSLT